MNVIYNFKFVLNSSHWMDSEAGEISIWLLIYISTSVCFMIAAAFWWNKIRHIQIYKLAHIAFKTTYKKSESKQIMDYLVNVRAIFITKCWHLRIRWRLAPLCTGDKAYLIAR